MNHLRARLLASLAILIGIAILAWAVFGVSRFRPEVTLRLTAGQDGGTYLPFAKHLAEIIEAKNPQIKVEVLESEGSLKNAKRIVSGEADLALVQNDIPEMGRLSGIVPLYSGALHIVVRHDSKLKELSQFRGKKVGVGQLGSGTGQIVEALLSQYDLSSEDVELVSFAIEDGFAALGNGEIDVLMLMLGIGSPAVESAADRGGIRLLPVGRSDQKGSELDSFHFHYPFAEATLIPRYAYSVSKNGTPGIPSEAIPAVSIQTVLTCRPDLSTRLVEEITRTIFENRAALVRRYPPASEISESFDPGGLQFPLHDGASRYLRRHEPGFLVKYAEVMGFSLSLLIAIWGLCAATKSWVHQRQKDRIDEYYLQLNEILERLEPNDLDDETLFAIHERLRALRREAVRLLSEERLQPDESFRIFQSLLSDCQNRVQRMRGG